MIPTVNGITPENIVNAQLWGGLSSSVGPVQLHGVHTGQGWHILALNAGDQPAVVVLYEQSATVPARRAPGTYGVARLGVPLRVLDGAQERLAWMLGGFDLGGPKFTAIQKPDIYPNTGQKGSPRVSWGAVPAAVASLWGQAVALESLRAWADVQLAFRAVHQVEPHDNGPPSSPTSGHWRTYDTQHFEMDKLAALAALANDPGAWISLRWHAEAAIAEGSRMVTAREDSQRALGWVLQALGTWDAMLSGYDQRAMSVALHLADYLDAANGMQADLKVTVPNVIINVAARTQPDHGGGVSTWMTSRIGLGAIRCGLSDRPFYERCIASMRYAHEVSVDGLGTHVLDYDQGYARQGIAHGQNPFGSYGTTASVHLLSWLSGEADLREHVAEYHWRADAMRVADKNYMPWLGHVLGPELGWR